MRVDRPAHLCARGMRCQHVVTHDKPCPVHGSAPAYRWDTDRRETPRIAGRKLQVLRLALFVDTVSQGKGCAACGLPFRSMAEMVRDHVVPLAEGETDRPDNVGCQAICVTCHQAKTQQESQRGKRRV
jgi:5-methylcytosine-specific restriction endonuclease McrA